MVLMPENALTCCYTGVMHCALHNVKCDIYIEVDLKKYNAMFQSIALQYRQGGHLLPMCIGQEPRSGNWPQAEKFKNPNNFFGGPNQHRNTFQVGLSRTSCTIKLYTSTFITCRLTTKSLFLILFVGETR